MMRRWSLVLGCAWLAALAAGAYPCLRTPKGSLARDLWVAAAVPLLSLLGKLVKMAVADPRPPRKILSVAWDILLRMGLALAVAALLYFGMAAGLTDRFWIGLAFFYQIALALETGLLLHEWNAGTSTESGGPVK